MFKTTIACFLRFLALFPSPTFIWTFSSLGLCGPYILLISPRNFSSAGRKAAWWVSLKRSQSKGAPITLGLTMGPLADLIHKVDKTHRPTYNWLITLTTFKLAVHNFEVLPVAGPEPPMLLSAFLCTKTDKCMSFYFISSHLLIFGVHGVTPYQLLLQMFYYLVVLSLCRNSER